MYKQYEKANTLKEALTNLKREYKLALENNADEKNVLPDKSFTSLSISKLHDFANSMIYAFVMIYSSIS